MNLSSNLEAELAEVLALPEPERFARIAREALKAGGQAMIAATAAGEMTRRWAEVQSELTKQNVTIRGVRSDVKAIMRALGVAESPARPTAPPEANGDGSSLPPPRIKVASVHDMAREAGEAAAREFLEEEHHTTPDLETAVSPPATRSDFERMLAESKLRDKAAELEEYKKRNEALVEKNAADRAADRRAVRVGLIVTVGGAIILAALTHAWGVTHGVMQERATHTQEAKP
jgi:hypothetical protein